MNTLYMHRMYYSKYHVLFKNAIQNRIGYFISLNDCYCNEDNSA